MYNIFLHLYTQNEVSTYYGSKIIDWRSEHKDRQTDTHTHTHENITYPYVWMVKIQKGNKKGYK